MRGGWGRVIEAIVTATSEDIKDEDEGALELPKPTL